MMGPALGFNWPRKLLLELEDILRAIDYVIRESGELGGKDKSLVLHYGLDGDHECRVMVSGATIGVETARMSMTTLSTCSHCCNCAFARWHV
eukprot:scaffold3147_cov110-Isochrysis_galbana.AAC.2